MIANKKIAIIGSGIAGLSLAMRARQSGFLVDLFHDPKTKPASQACIGIFGVKGLWHGDNQHFSQQIAGCLALPAFIREVESISGQSVGLRFGVSEYFSTEAEYRSLAQRIYHGRFSGCLDFSLRQIKTQGHSLFPGSSYLGAFYYPQDGYFHTDSLLLALKRALAILGVRIFDEAITGLKRESDQTSVISAGVLGRYDHVVLAAGASSINLLSKFFDCSLPHKVANGFSITANLLGDGALMRIGRQSLAHQKNRLFFGSFEEGMEAAFVKTRLTNLGLKCNDLDSLELEFRHGSRIGDKYGKPYVGPFHHICPNLWLFFGFYKDGFSLADLWAKKLVKQMAEAV